MGKTESKTKPNHDTRQNIELMVVSVLERVVLVLEEFNCGILNSDDKHYAAIVQETSVYY